MLFLTYFISAFSQENFCGSTEASKELYLKHPELLQQQDLYNAELEKTILIKQQQRTSTTENIYVIPIVFHIIHANGSENISDEQIQDQVDILNRDFRKLNPDISQIIPNTSFDTLAADTKIEFRLAQIDPKGQCTNGIDRIYSQRTNAADNSSKLNQWPRNKYLNVWTVNSIGNAGVAGYAYLPPDVANNPTIDGIIILSNYIGSIGTGNPARSRALTHEIGHYLGLYHTWGGTNNPEVDCSGSDQVADTPPTKGHLTCDLYTPYCTLYNFINTAYNFSNVTTTSGTLDPTPVPVNNGTTFSAVTAVGTSANSTESSVFSFSGWGKGGETSNHDTAYTKLTGSLDTTKYYEVTLTPRYNNSLTLTDMTFSFKRDSAGVRTFAVRSSADGFKNNLEATVTPANGSLQLKPGNIFFSVYDTTDALNGSKISLSSFKNLIKPITFRIYGWNAEDSTGTFGIDSLVFTGKAGIIENTQNYMDYSYCSVMYTTGQKNRMRAALESSVSGRNNLWTTANLTATGTNGNGQLCSPTADFYMLGGTFACTDKNVSFKSNVANNSPNTPLTYFWEFPAGDPATSTLSDPSVNFPSAGYHDVKLTISNSAGSNTVSKNAYVYVYDKGGDYALSDGFSEGFEDPNRYNDKWHVFNLDKNAYGWERANVGYSSQYSVKMNSYGNFQGDVDQLLSPSTTMSFMKDLKLSIRYAAATRATTSANMTDALNVYYSVNCGASWVLVMPINGSTLANNGYHSENYVPKSDAEWKLRETNIPVANTNNKLILKFEYKSGAYSNNLYIDNINLSGTVGIEETIFQESSITIFPNPSKESATLNYYLNQRNQVTIEINDILGKQVVKFDQGILPEGEHSLILSKEDLKLKTGIYFIRLTSGNQSVTRKLLFTE